MHVRCLHSSTIPRATISAAIWPTTCYLEAYNAHLETCSEPCQLSPSGAAATTAQDQDQSIWGQPVADAPGPAVVDTPGPAPAVAVLSRRRVVFAGYLAVRIGDCRNEWDYQSRLIAGQANVDCLAEWEHNAAPLLGGSPWRAAPPAGMAHVLFLAVLGAGTLFVV
ncbi:hypothetical protein V8E36_009597 [Tilletia maclaganii]